MKRRNLIALLSVLFIGVNILLIYVDDEKVDRTFYVKDWTQTNVQDMYENLHTQGVLDFMEDENVYFDNNKGEFQEFLVEEGEMIEAGDPLYTYTINNYYETLSEFQSENEKLKDEIAGIESAISKMETYQIPQQTLDYTFIEEDEDDKSTTLLETPQDSVEAELMKEQYITEKEKELSEKKAQWEAVQSQLEDLASGDDSVVVESPFDGRVTMVSKSLDNPIITVQPPDIHVVAELTEGERKQVVDDMAVDIEVDENTGTLDGVMSDVSEYPDSSSIDGVSKYPINITFSDENDTEGLLAGYHTELAIQIDKSINATTLDKEWATKNAVWQMTTEGTLDSKTINKGIQMDNKVEITRGLEPGDWVVDDAPNDLRSDSNFITPLKWNDINWGSVFKSKHWDKGFFTGLLFH